MAQDLILSGPSFLPEDETKRAVVFFHGYGANGHDLYGLSSFLKWSLPQTAFYDPKSPDYDSLLSSMKQAIRRQSESALPFGIKNLMILRTGNFRREKVIFFCRTMRCSLSRTLCFMGN